MAFLGTVGEKKLFRRGPGKASMDRNRVGFTDAFPCFERLLGLDLGLLEIFIGDEGPGAPPGREGWE